MSTQVQYRRGTQAQNDSFTGALAEITVDTTNWSLRVHDGVTAGGTATVSANSSAQLQTGNLLPQANLTYNLGSATKMWKSLYVSGNTIYLGNLQLKESSANTFAVFTSDGTTQANLDVGNIDVSSLTQGTSTIGIAATNGNAYITVGGTSNVVVVATTGSYTTGLASVTGNVIGGNINTAGVVSATGNVTSAGNVSGSYLLGNAYYVTGLSPTQIYNGTSNVAIASSDGNIRVNVGGTSNVVVWATTGEYVTGLISASGNVTGGNLNTGAQVVATGNITGGNILTGGLVSATGNVSGGYLLGAFGNVTSTLVVGFNEVSYNTTIDNAGINTNLLSASGNITGGNVTTAGAVTVNGVGITASAGGGGTIVTATAVLGRGLFGALPYGAADGGMPGLGYFTANDPTGLLQSIEYTVGDNTTRLTFNPGTYGSNVVTSTSINGLTTMSATIGGITSSAGTFADGGGVLQVSYTGDVFSLVSKNGTTVSVSMSVAATAGTLTIDSSTSVTGTVTGGNVNTSGTISATGNITGGNISTSGAYFGGIVQAGGYATAGTISATSNITGGNLSAGTGTITVGGLSFSGNTIVSTGPTLTIDPNSSGGTDGAVVIAGNLSVTGNVTYFNSNVVTVNDKLLNLANNAATAAAADGSGIGVGPLASEYASITYNSTANIWVLTNGANVSGALNTTGNITGGNVLTGGLISATGNITGGNLSGTNIVGTLTTAAQTNITSVGTLSSLTVTANVTGGNILTAGIMSSTGNATHGNLSVSTGTITGGNIVNSNANGVGNIGSATTYFNTVFAKATSAQYADLAERYVSDASYEPGTVLDFGGQHEVTISTVSSSSRIAGVVSTNPAYVMNAGQEGEHTVVVALTGRVPTSVVGTVAKGDMMVSGGNGVAIACATPAIGTVIGKALENYNSDEPGVIEIVVGRL